MLLHQQHRRLRHLATSQAKPFSCSKRSWQRSQRTLRPATPAPCCCRASAQRQRGSQGYSRYCIVPITVHVSKTLAMDVALQAFAQRNLYCQALLCSHGPSSLDIEGRFFVSICPVCRCLEPRRPQGPILPENFRYIMQEHRFI